MNARRAFDRVDACVALALAASALAVGSPVLLEGGYASYLDAPAHLAVIRALATHGVWSDVALAGLPADALRSPLGFQLLATLVRWGLDVGVTYAIVLWLAALLPALAVYYAARVRTHRGLAAAIAWLVLASPAVVVGRESVFGGAWAPALATAATITLAHVLFVPLTPGRWARIATLVALVGCLDVLTLPCVALVLVVRGIARRDEGTREDVLSALLGLAASFAWWGPAPASLPSAFFVALGLRAVPIAAVLALALLGPRAGPEAPTLAWPRLVGAFLLAVALSVLAGLPLRAVVDAPRSPAMGEVAQLWSWLRTHRAPGWGRVFVVDTFHADVAGTPLTESHVLARTSIEADVRAIGAFATEVPLATAGIADGSEGRIAGVRDDTPESRAEIVRRLHVLGVTQLVTPTEALRARAAGLDGARELARVGRFTVLEIDAAPARWVETGPSITRAVASWQSPAILTIDAEVVRAGAGLRAQLAWLPSLRLSGPRGAHLERSQDGLVLVRGIPEGAAHLVITFAEPRWPLVFSALAWLFVVALAIGGRSDLAVPEPTRDVLTASLLAAMIAVAAVTLSPLRPSGGDTIGGRYGALGIACDGDTTLEGIDWIARRDPPPYYVRRGLHGEAVSTFGPAPAVLAALSTWNLEPGASLDDDELRARTREASAGALALACALVAAAVALRRGPWFGALAGATAALSFAGAATLGQDVWQQTTALPLWIAALAALAHADRDPRGLSLVPALLALAVMVRPGTAGIALGLGWIWWRLARAMLPRNAVVLALGVGVLSAVPLALWSHAHLGTWVPLAQLDANRAMTDDGSAFDLSPAHLGVALAGLLISPARGLLWFAPVALLGAFAAWRHARARPLLLAMGAQLALAVAFHKWWGGLGFGPRLLAEATWLGIYAAFVWPPSRSALALTAVLTVLVGLLGLARYDPRAWEIPRDPDHHGAALWDVADGPLPALLGTPPEGPALRDAPEEPFVFCGPRGATSLE